MITLELNERLDDTASTETEQCTLTGFLQSWIFIVLDCVRSEGVPVCDFLNN